MSEEPEINLKNSLFHYTDWKGLQGILQTKTLWATHFRYLNDEMEGVFGQEQFKKDWVTRFPNQDAETVIKTVFNSDLDDCFVVSFCKSNKENYEDGLLSQWRGYGKDGGYAIQFDRKKIHELIKAEKEKYAYLGLQMWNMGYGNNKNYLDLVPQTWLPTHNQISEHSLILVLQYLLWIKHSGFEEESEVRIAAVLVPPKRFDEPFEEGYVAQPQKPIHFRDGAIPYIKLFEGLGNLPIERIIVGPHKDKEKRKDALQLMLRDTDIIVEASGIPYIG